MFFCRYADEVFKFVAEAMGLCVPDFVGPTVCLQSSNPLPKILTESKKDKSRKRKIKDDCETPNQALAAEDFNQVGNSNQSHKVDKICPQKDIKLENNSINCSLSNTVNNESFS